MHAAILFGRSQLALGAVGEVGGDGIGAALSRGGAPKPYEHTDPNEDAVLAARGARGHLVTIADGHWGVRAAEIAIEVVRDQYLEDFVDGADRGADRWYQCLLQLLVTANTRIVQAQRDEQRARTTFALALARPAEKLLVATSIGDSHLFLGAPSGTREILQKPRKLTVLGYEDWGASQMERMARFDVRPLEDVEALVAVTDGISEEGIGVADPLATITAALDGARHGPDRALHAARAIVAAAMTAHASNRAGDNIAAGVVWADGSR